MKKTITLNGKTYKLVEETKQEFITVIGESGKEYKVCSEDLKPTDIDNLPKGCTENSGFYYWTWDSAMKEAKKQGVRLPTFTELTDLVYGQEGNNEDNKAYKLKDLLGLEYAGNDGGSNQGTYALYWSSTEYSSTSARYLLLYSTSGLYWDSTGKTNDFTVRCFKDQ